MRRAAASGLAAMTLLAMAAAPAAAAKMQLMPPASESSTSAKAKGPQPYQASSTGSCAGQSCQVKFGKKKGKVRRITDISCLLVSSTGTGLGALIRVDERQISYLPLTSRGTSGAGEFASGALSIRFDILGGEVLDIELASSMDASAANCTVLGSIE